MRFVQMPFGPDRLDFRLSLMNEEVVPADFFEHASHHPPDRKVETENLLMKTAMRFALIMVYTLSCVSEGLSQTPAVTTVHSDR
jgi:hypothetical protein